MNRRDFLKVTAASVLATSAETLNAKIFDNATCDSEKGISIRFLGTGAADWNGRDSRGEHRRLSSILIDRHILIDFTSTDVEMLPEGCRPDVPTATLRPRVAVCVLACVRVGGCRVVAHGRHPLGWPCAARCCSARLAGGGWWPCFLSSGCARRCCTAPLSSFARLCACLSWLLRCALIRASYFLCLRLSTK